MRASYLEEPSSELDGRFNQAQFASLEKSENC